MYNQEAKSALPPYRILDLTEGGCMLGGRLLADLGADVITIEPPGVVLPAPALIIRISLTRKRASSGGPIMPIKEASPLILLRRKDGNYLKI